MTRDIPRIGRLASGSLAGFLSLALHVLFLAPLVAGRPGAPGPRHPIAPSTLTLIDLGDSAAEPAAAHLPSPPALGAIESLESPREIVADVPQVEINVPGDGAMEHASADRVPPYVRYMGQVTARIQRLWSVPVGKGATEFHCRATIRSGPAGEVENLTLQPCDEDPALKASVLEAIRLAAPLPSRPDAETSAGALTLDFAVFATTAEGRRSSVQPGAADPPTADARL